MYVSVISLIRCYYPVRYDYRSVVCRYWNSLGVYPCSECFITIAYAYRSELIRCSSEGRDLYSWTAFECIDTNTRYASFYVNINDIFAAAECLLSNTLYVRFDLDHLYAAASRKCIGLYIAYLRS